MSRSPSSRRALARAAVLLLLLAAVAYPVWRLVRSPGRFNLLVVLVDTLRADHLACYGYSRDTSPTIDGLAAEGILFEECLAPAPWTIASTATLLTGLEPFAHGFVRPEFAPLAPAAVTIAEVLRDRGYRTAGFSGNMLISELSGFDQGFSPLHTDVWGKAPTLNAGAIPWLRENGPRGRFFLYMHYFDPHDPYDDPEGLWRSYAGLAPGAPAGEERCRNGDIEEAFQSMRDGEDPGLTAADKVRLVDRYDGEIRFVDGEIGKLLAEVRALGLEDETVVVFTSDHGEQFFEHGGMKHGSSLFREELHVPLVFRVPGGRKGERRPERVGLVDVFPTVLGLLGIDAPGPVDGRDVLGSPPDPGRLAFSETSHGWATLDGLQKEGQELLSVRGPGGKTAILGPETAADYPRFFDDPAESKNLAGPPPPAWADDLVREIRDWRAKTAARVLPNRPLSPERQKEMRGQLEKLGYIGKPRAANPKPKPAPPEKADEAGEAGEKRE